MHIQSARTSYNLEKDSDVQKLKKNLYKMHSDKKQTQMLAIYNQVEICKNYSGNNKAFKAACEIFHYLDCRIEKPMLNSPSKSSKKTENNTTKPDSIVSQTLPTPLLTSTVTRPAQNTLVPLQEPSVYNIGLITDVRLFPRSEYYTRFEGTTVFAMNEPKYWGTYHRSESSRFFDEAGGRKKTQFQSPCAKKSSGTHSFFAHTGGFHSPFSMDPYASAIQLEKLVDEGSVNVRDRLLLYKNDMAKVVVKSFAEFEKNEQRIGKSYLRPIVYTENDYPCVLINLPTLNPAETQTQAAKYWAQHPKPFQQLLLSSFIAFLNVEAMRANIPIEMVLRASFGSNLPSVCETNNTFRINVGVIPKSYAALIGRALHLLNQSIRTITDTSSPSASFDTVFLTKVRTYNAKKLKKAINEKERYKVLRDTPDFQQAESSAEAFEQLYAQFCAANAEKRTKGSAKFQPVVLENKTIWQVIRQAGDSMGKSVLSECFRQKGTEDWFTNQVMDALLADSPAAIETALSKLLACLSYDDRVTMDYKKIHQELKVEKRKFMSRSFEGLYADDAEFSGIVKLLCDALLVERPSQALYAVLEQAGATLLSTYRSSEIPSQDPDFGSDSAFSDDLADAKSTKRSHISHSKLRVCSGMKAILLAQYAALSYLRSIDSRAYAQDVQQMYYEVEEALKLVDVSPSAMNKVRAAKDAKILHFDLNHCNSKNAVHNVKLEEKLSSFNPSIIILDYTSGTASAIKEALQKSFANENTKLVILVNSGLKNDQGGLDFNPYGEIRICAKDRATVKKVSAMINKGLSKEDKLSQKTHEMVRVCKKRGMALSLSGLFKAEKERFQVTGEERQVSRLKM